MSGSPRPVAVTGASGFLGAAAVRALARAGWPVLAVVRTTSGLARLEPLAGGVRVLRVDALAARARLVSELRAFGVEGVLHAAWAGIRGAARDDPDQVENVARTVEWVRAAAEAGARRFVGVGSQAEYGPHDGPMHEELLPAPADLYGAAKLAAGHLALALARRLGVSAAWARVFSAYGPGETEGALVPDLARALLRGDPYPLTSCKQRWDYLYEDDAAEALLLLLARDDARGAFNVASGTARPLEDAVRAIAERVAPGAALAFGAKGGTPRSLVADVGRLFALGWRPRTPLEDGLERTIAAVRAREGAAGAGEASRAGVQRPGSTTVRRS
jgi:nucleoside-diphosphate-sugar epimerase